jgi:hypothetical protein
MSWRSILLTLALVGLPGSALASCDGSTCTCSTDASHEWSGTSFLLDLTQQYLDMNRARAGRHDVPVGFVPSGEDEVRTITRITALRATYRPAPEWTLTANLPYLSRTHEHIMNEPGMPPEPMRWSYSGVGDAEIGFSRTLLGSAEQGPELRLLAGVKMPTGRRSVPEVNGEQPEPPARPGTGSWDGTLGASARSRVMAPAPGGARAVPLRADLTARWNGSGTDGYRSGREVQAHVSAEYSIAKAVDFLAQGNFRARDKDDVGSSDAERENSGGTWAFFTPGLRVGVAEEVALYGLVQIPVYQRVNRIQLVSDYNLYFGLTRPIF